MAGFLYYFPGEQRVTEERLQALSLQHVADLPFTQRGTKAGPTAGGGVLVWHGDKSQTYQPDRQTWSECKGFWLGYETLNQPGPADLLRSDAIDGYFVELAHGTRWQIPTPKMQDGGSSLPQAVRLDAEGKPRLESLPRYETLAHCAEQAFKDFEEGAEQDWERCWDACVVALGTNYRVSRWEVAALGVLTTGTVMRTVLAALGDWFGFLRMKAAEAEAAKKNGSASTLDTSDISGGGNG